jgi:multidrug resistance efflux pump
MPTPFSRTIRSLEADSARPSIVGLAAAVLLLAAWAGWFVLGEVTVYEATAEARLEVARAPHPIAPQVGGRIVSSRLELGREVHAGELLVEIDAEPQRLGLREEETRAAAASAQLAALRAELEAAESAAAETAGAAPVALDEARARYDEAVTAARAAAAIADRYQRLRDQGLLSDIELLKARAEAERLHSVAESLRIGLDRQDRDQRARASDRRARSEALRRQIAEAEGEIATRAATAKRLIHDVDARRVVAPVDGRLGEVAGVRVGAVVAAGEPLGAVVPSGRLRVVAQFPPSAAIGRLRPGMPARVRLEGFPWTEFGQLAAEVASVGAEPRSGTVRVELELRADPDSRIPLEHGLPGSVEIAVERVSPATLALRTLGGLLSRRGADER